VRWMTWQNIFARPLEPGSLASSAGMGLTCRLGRLGVPLGHGRRQQTGQRKTETRIVRAPSSVSVGDEHAGVLALLRHRVHHLGRGRQVLQYQLDLAGG